MEYFFLGDEELVTAFRFIGIEGVSVNNAEEAVTVFRNITENVKNNFISPDFDSRNSAVNLPSSSDCKVIIVTEEMADWLGEYMINWQISGHYPLLVEIPGITGRQEGRKTLVELIREAIGIHI